MVKTWKKMEEPGEIPWTPQDKSLSESTLAIISSAGLALNSDRPFDQEGERANPWWGDPSYRVLPRTAAVNEIRLYHMHINPSLVKQDLNTLFPLQTALGLEKEGIIGKVADRHYSYMGYILQPETLLEESVPAMILQMQKDQVDSVLLAPG